MIYGRMDSGLWKVDYQSLIWNYSIIDIDCVYVLLLYVDLLLNYRIGLLFLYKPVDQIRGHVRPMSALDPVIEHGGACSGLVRNWSAA